MEAVCHVNGRRFSEIEFYGAFVRAVVLSGNKYFEASFVTPDPEVGYFCPHTTGGKKSIW